MNREFRIRGTMFVKLSDKALFRRVFLSVLVLVLGIGSVGQNTEVHAAPSQQSIEVDKTFTLRFHPPAVICVGQTYDVKVTVLLELSGTNASGQKFDYKDRIVPGITIQASVQDTNIASVSPSQLSSGLLPNPNDLLITGEYGSSLNGQVTFKLSGKKPGATNLYLKAPIPTSLAGSPNIHKDSEVPFRVAYCRYKVSAASITYFTAPGLTSTLVGITSGEMQLVDQSGETSRLSGSSDADWTLNSFSPDCSHEHEIPKATAKLEGTLTMDDKLNVDITFDPFEMVTGNCGSGSTGSFPIPPIHIEVPAGGGSKNITQAFPLGNMSMHGNAVIFVQPIPGQ